MTDAHRCVSKLAVVRRDAWREARSMPNVRREANLTVIDDFFKYLNSKDVDSWIDLWADDGRILVPYPPEGAGFPSIIEGRGQILPGFQQLFAMFDSYRAEVVSRYPTIDPEVVVVEWTVEAHLTNGERYQGSNITVFRFHEGKIAEYHDYFNPERFRVVVQALAG
jgi:ketosteroid isomerase-like protein